jgi:hypothetical protein
MSKYIILGTDECDADRVHPPKREPPNLLTRFGSKKSLRVSILIDYELPEAAEYEKPSDIAEQFRELQQLRIRVYKAEFDFYDRAMSNRRRMARWVRVGAIAPTDVLSHRTRN